MVSSLTLKKVVSPGFWVTICVRWVFKNRIWQNKVFIFLFGISMIEMQKTVRTFCFWRPLTHQKVVSLSYDVLRPILLLCSIVQKIVTQSYDVLRWLTTLSYYISYSFFVSWKNREKMVKRSNEVIIIVLNFVRMLIFSFCIIICSALYYSLHSVALFHGSAHNA